MSNPVQPPSNRRTFGRSIEQEAWRWLSSSGTRRLLDRNWSWRGGELDLIFEERGARGWELVFCEVRSRAPGSFLDPAETVTHPKRLKLARTAARYLIGYRGSAKALRFDVLGWNGREWHHRVAAFEIESY